MSKQEIPKRIQEIFDSIKNKRAKIVIDHIIKYGQITTEELEKDYGYNHAPRAARDVREAGIPLITNKVKSSDGKRNIAAYTFGDFSTIRLDRVKGRISWPKNFKRDLIQRYGQICLISNVKLESRALQIDHRIPYELAGDKNEGKPNIEDFMLLSGTSNRAKSWSCEHCKNLTEIKDLEKCKSCYWAYPENYSHVALNEARKLDLTWQGDEVKEYDALKSNSEEVGEELPDYVKEILRKNIK